MGRFEILVRLLRNLLRKRDIKRRQQLWSRQWKNSLSYFLSWFGLDAILTRNNRRINSFSFSSGLGDSRPSGIFSLLLKIAKAYSMQYFLYVLAALLLLSQVDITLSGRISRNVALCEPERERKSRFQVFKVTGDGSCLFRSVAAGYTLLHKRNEMKLDYKREEHEKMSYKLRQKAVEELVKRKDEVKWFVEGDFDTYVENMKNKNVWGGETELIMLTHVLKHPIAVYMHEENDESSAFIKIAEYGTEYSTTLRNKSEKSTAKSENSNGNNISESIRVLFHGHGHYELLTVRKRGGDDQIRNAEWILSKL
uniref:Ubiquitin thioesterase OTU n=1 Tax=Aplanochytrium stocchinoi TaxID=215587 RepID=A0A7S3LQP4_9STRA